IRNLLNLNRINAVHILKHVSYRTAVGLSRASTSFGTLGTTWMAGTSPAMTALRERSPIFDCHVRQPWWAAAVSRT
ncbi:hypothetical protein ACQR0Z_34200, partial [Bradyrhizobium sp. HKCCYLS3077]|uniref:hypothetical protein n=1 Tax=Bradyrhizobium sp. HKCCYLS3077 TaxID=3420761 RepID=UPI003EBFA55A